MTSPIIIRTELDADQAAAVLALADHATHADGVAPLSEQILLRLRHGGEVSHLLAHHGRGAEAAATGHGAGDSADGGAGDLVGYAQLDTADANGPAAELAVHPEYRRHGVATALLDELERASDRSGGRLRLWAHGQHPGATALARRRGYVAERVLWQMRRSLLPPLPEPEVPPGVLIRPFRVGQDEQAWTEVNNRAFASHPDQGGWDVGDLREREGEPWFDPAGFLVAERVGDGAMLGFHWTKVHPAAPAGGTIDTGAGAGADAGLAAAGPIGEVYVVGVDPAAQGMGLGRVLTMAGLHHLRGTGLGRVMLYVDESNTAAMALYTRLGFLRWRADVQYRRP